MSEAELALLGGEPVRTQPFHRWPHWDAREARALHEVLEEGSWGGYPAPNRRARAFADAFAAYTGAAHGVCCANGSVALELAIQAARIEPGSEIIVPAYTFTATASSVVHCGCVPVFVDVDPDTYCMDAAAAAERVTGRTRAIIPVHLACNMADMDAICELAARHELVVIEDCAHAHGARWRGRGAGSIGHAGTFSFQTSKLMTAGEGGAVLTSEREIADRLQSLANCGRKEPGHDRFEGAMLGHNYRLTEWQAAILSVQLERLEAQTRQRERALQRLESGLRELPMFRTTERDPRNDTRSAYQVIVRYDEAGAGVPRERILEALRAENIPCEGDFYDPVYACELFPMDPLTNPLAAAPAGAGHDVESVRCPVTERAARSEAIWLPHPLFLGPDGDVDDVVGAFHKLAARLTALR